MNLTLIDVCLIFALICFISIAWQHFKVREYTLRRVKQQCSKLDLQMLDESIYGSYWRPVIQRGQIKIKRRYQFYFTSTGEGRYKGEIEMIGMQQSHIHFDPHAM
ncbi:DUF3301 domain-containing protein [Marinomonas atlantica]|uniref:DUF3301 domain-containing protein n=1 Tax=Marinomonas atlantica TaxID=1806668 RepID=UPI00082ED27B|nr:DUF3301 domain-containing protein [Marinomonas atlantica]MCO4784756.1 DUF3301 domain-containing protein [Marinomonas atlantica]